MKLELYALALAYLAAAANGFVLATPTSRFTSTKLRSTAVKGDEVINELLSFAEKVGPVGSLASEDERDQINEIAQRVAKIKGDKKPARAPLRGIHNLVYSAAPGGSSGRLFGPVSGKVTQEFVEDDKTFINAVKIGPLEVSLQAEKIVKSDDVNVVKFKKSIVKVFGNTVVEKDISGGGTWKYLYMGKVKGPDGKLRLLRVMETPSLFVIEQLIPEE